MSSYVDALARKARDAGRQLGLGSEDAETAVSRPVYRSLRERLRVAKQGGPVRSIVFAGCGAADVGTRVAREFAESLSGEGLRVLGIEGDFRRPPAPGRPGVLDLVGLVHERRSPAPKAGVQRVCVLQRPADPDRFLRSAEFSAWMKAQLESFDAVVVDAPPVLPCADALLFAKAADGLALVVRAHRTLREDLAAAHERLAQGGCRPLGVVLEGVESLPPGLRALLTDIALPGLPAVSR